MYSNIYYQREKNLVHLWDSKQGYRSFPYTRYAYEKAERGEYTTLYGDKVTKIYKFKGDDPTLFESDVPETTRVLVDMYTDSDVPSEGHVILTYDIECEMESGLPNPEEATNELTSIALHDSATNQYWVLVMDKKGEMIERQTDKAIVIPFRTEEDMLMKYLELYEYINPSIVTGWNIDYFDTPMLYNRMKRLLGERHANRLSPIGQCFWSPYRKRFFMAGVSYLDYLSLYKNFTYSELDSYRLDSIAQRELGRGKIEYEGNLDILFRDDIEKFIEYNLVDVELVVDFDKKLQFIDTARGICHAGHVPYEDFVYSSKYLEGALLCYLKRKNIVAPNKPADRRERMEALKEAGTEKFIGAYVKAPIVGKYDWIYDLDLTSLYPSIIMSINISPETKVGKLEDWDAQKYLKGEVKFY
jgi:DNA polymerase elongation subunit (family B)